MIYIQKGIKKIEKKKEEGWVAEMLVLAAEREGGWQRCWFRVLRWYKLGISGHSQHP